MELVLERAIYGKKGTPMLKRDYTVLNFPTNAKTTVSELLVFCKNQNIPVEKLLLIDEIEGTNTILAVDEKYNFSEIGTHYM